MKTTVCDHERITVTVSGIWRHLRCPDCPAFAHAPYRTPALPPPFAVQAKVRRGTRKPRTARRGASR
ncbi:hypothetical protein ACH4FX_12065 [Streptomyces sp. NPDC018019]|uniref:hypothetical protein n=1 Tax=Streptomyces sp. NPDC018019 TaxID=3365030 RepID=UPI0037B872C7